MHGVGVDEIAVSSADDDSEQLPTYIAYQHHAGLFLERSNRNHSNFIIEIPEDVTMRLQYKNEF